MNLPDFASKDFFGLNWIDILILVTLLFYAIEGYALGFFNALLDLISFVLAFFLGLSFYAFFGKLLITYLSISPGFANAIGFFIAAFLTEIIFNLIFKGMVSNFFYIKELDQKAKILHKINNFLGVIPAVFSGILLLSFILVLLVTLPVKTFLKQSVSDSKIGSSLVVNTQGLAKDLNAVFGGAVDEGLSFLTVEPKSDQTINLNFKTSSISPDPNAERQMFIMVSRERSQRELVVLDSDESLAKVARSHCRDMLERGYFSHYTPEGYSPFDRMARADISFNFAGENLALAPNVDLAMKGLMQSPGHRANILSPNFGKIGIGVMDAGVYGKMFCQEFTD